MNMKISVLSFIFSCFFSQYTFAFEQLGKLSLKSLHLKPKIILQEPQKGGFSLGDSLFSIGWVFEPNISAVLKVAQPSLINTNRLFKNYNQAVGEELVFVEAYGQYDAIHGQFRFGRIPVGYGYEASTEEEHLDLPRSIYFSNRLAGLRDLGFSYFTETKNYYASLVIHNGEGDSNVDGHLWYTGLWGWKFSNMLKLGLMGQTGETSPLSTENSSFNYLNFDKGLAAKIRSGGLFIAYRNNRLFSLFEANILVLRQSEVDLGQLGVGHWDLSYSYSRFGSFFVAVSVPGSKQPGR